MEDHETRRKIIREWMALPKEKRQTEEKVAAFAKKAVQQNEFHRTRSVPEVSARSISEINGMAFAACWQIVSKAGAPCRCHCRRVSIIGEIQKVDLCAQSRTRLHKDWQSTVGPLA
jgi:hypothetical protein